MIESHRHRRFSVQLVIVVASLWACIATVHAAPAAPATAGERPNVVLIVADDMGFADVGFNGCTDIKTPNIDRLASSGVRLDQWYVQPICSPTRAALMTGRYPMRQGLHVGVIRPWSRYGLPLEERTLAQALKDAGYETAITGKWHLGHFQPEYLPTRRGFEHQYGHYNGQIEYFEHTREGGYDWHRNDKVNREEGYSTHLIAAEAVKRIEQRDAKRPLFLYVPFNAPHGPHQVPEKYKEPYKNLKEPRQTYAGMMAAMDEGIGQILDAIEARGIRENTLVLFTSDNGGAEPGKVTNNGPLKGGKGGLNEGGVRVAACAAWPGKIPAGGTVTQPLHIVDVYPTLLKLAGAKAEQPLPIDGLDVWPTLASGAPMPARVILLNATPVNGAIRSGDWKLMVDDRAAAGASAAAADDAEDSGAKEGGAKSASAKRQARQLATAKAKGIGADATVKLYNLAKDPGESKDLAAEHPEKVKELRAAFDQLAAQAIPSKTAPRPADFKAPAVWGGQ
jgi:arylsulfatase A-like enzyme